MKAWWPRAFLPGLVILAGLRASALPPVVAARPPAKAGAAPGFEGWTPTAGAWAVRGDVYVQTDRRADCRAFAPPAAWDDYVYEVKARKTGGSEGFLILFRVQDRRHFYWWNVGGWGNSRHAVETRPRKFVSRGRAGRIETGRWYDVKIVVRGPAIQCYLDGKLIHDLKHTTYKTGGVGWLRPRRREAVR